MKTNLRLSIFFLSLILPSMHSHAAKPFSFSGSASIGNDNNLSFGSYGRDIVSDEFTNLTLKLKHQTNLSKNKRLILSSSFGLQSYSKYDSLNNNSFDIKANYQFQLSNRFRSPIYGLFLKLGQSDYNSDLRDNLLTEFGLTLNWRHDDRTLFRASFISTDIDADETSDALNNKYQTFDNQRTSLSFAINIKQTAKLSFYSSIGLISGDITANWTTQTIDQYEIGFPTIRTAWETIPDTIFGNNWESTKYTADITKLAIGFNYSLSQNNAVDTIIELLDADAGIYSYSIERLSLSYLHKF